VYFAGSTERSVVTEKPDQLAKVLSRLEDKRDEELPASTLSAVYRGIAVGKTRTHLQLAIENGILLIPLDTISHIRELNYVDPNVVAVEVDDFDSTRTILAPTTEQVRPRLSGHMRFSDEPNIATIGSTESAAENGPPS
jgi:hypothetical protein